jgi:hypothetical protein
MRNFPRRKHFLILGVILACLWGYMPIAFAKDRIYSGRVIDTDTKKPIEGVVIVAMWLKELIISKEEYKYDVQETLTDGDGKWSLSIPGGKIDKLFLEIIPLAGKTVADVVGPHFIVFKPGYCSWPESVSVEVCRRKMKPGDNSEFIRDEVTVELPQLINKEDRRRALPALIHGGREIYMKERRFILLINAERRYLGLPEYKDLKEFEE